MRHRKFVVASTVTMLAFAALVTGLAFYSSHAASAFQSNVPDAIHYLPASSQGVFGMNVQAFVRSPIYKRFQAKQGDRIGQDLQDVINKTGVDPTRDIRYIVAAGGPGETMRGSGVVIAVPATSFNRNAIVAFIRSEASAHGLTPIEVPYTTGQNTSTVLMIPESDGNKLEKGIAFLNTGEIALGDLESLKKVLDVQAKPSLGIDSAPLGKLLHSPAIDIERMFWFAGDATSVMAKAPTNTPFGTNLSAVQTIYGTLDMTDLAVTGKVTVAATTKENADKLRDIVRGFVALGQMAAANQTQNPELAALANQIKLDVQSLENTVTLDLNLPYELIDKLEQLKTVSRKGI